MLGESVEGEYASIPSCVFTIPTAAWVGATEASLAQRGVEFRATRNDQTGWRSGRSYAEKHAWAKVLIGEDDAILGAHLLGHGAAEVVNLFSLAMRTGTKAKQLKEFVWAYPTFSNDAKFLV
jgi:glutathione reductase (NADPH)